MGSPAAEGAAITLTAAALALVVRNALDLRCATTRSTFPPGAMTPRGSCLAEHRNHTLLAFGRNLAPAFLLAAAAVYVPTTPNPTSGYLEIVPVERLVWLDWTTNQAMQFIISGGTVAPETIAFKASMPP